MLEELGAVVVGEVATDVVVDCVDESLATVVSLVETETVGVSLGDPKSSENLYGSQHRIYMSLAVRLQVFHQGWPGRFWKHFLICYPCSFSSIRVIFLLL